MIELNRAVQFETIALIKAYAHKIYVFPNDEIRPSEAARLKEIVDQMARIAKKLVVS